MLLYFYGSLSEKYDARIYTSPYDQDVSFVFTGIRPHMDFAEKMDTICAIAQTDNGSAFQQYIHWRYSTKSKVIDFASAPERYRCLVDTVQKTDFPVEMAKLSARGITVYSVDGITRELPAE